MVRLRFQSVAVIDTLTGPLIVTVSNEKVKNYVVHGRGPISLSLLVPDQASVLEETVTKDGFSVCSPVQVAIDLFCSGVGRDAAIKFLEVIRNGKVRSVG